MFPLGGVTVMTLASGLAGGQTLVCTEGLPPPVPYVTTPSTASSSSMSYPSTTADQRNDRYSTFILYIGSYPKLLW